MDFPAAAEAPQPGTEDPGPGPLAIPGFVCSLDPEHTFQEPLQATVGCSAVGLRPDLGCYDPQPQPTRQNHATIEFSSDVRVETAKGVREWLGATELVSGLRLGSGSVDKGEEAPLCSAVGV